MSRPTVVDLFAGAGGLTAGLEAAGWTTVALVDNDPSAAATLRATQSANVRIPNSDEHTYLSGARILEGDIAEIDDSDIRLRPGWTPDLLAGGPPCQPFSSAGRQRGVDDPRGQLFMEFVRLADSLRPRMIVFENVRGLVTAKDRKGVPGGVLRLIQESFEDIGYACRFAMLNAADYGAAQRRVRLFMFGTRDQPLPEFPLPTHARHSEELLEGLKPWVTLREFLEVQPAPDDEDVVRPSENRRQALEALEPGKGLRSGGIIEANRPSGHWGYRQDCFLADEALPARTIRAASTPDWIRLSDGTLRRLTWRECARLQGFPQDWQFQGTRAARFRQIGNAVQGDVALALGQVLRTASRDDRPVKPTSAPWPSEFMRRVRYTEMEHRVNGESRIERRLAI